MSVVKRLYSLNVVFANDAAPGDSECIRHLLSFICAEKENFSPRVAVNFDPTIRTFVPDQDSV